jgi:hypothetical protein
VDSREQPVSKGSALSAFIWTRQTNWSTHICYSCRRQSSILLGGWESFSLLLESFVQDVAALSRSFPQRCLARFCGGMIFQLELGPRNFHLTPNFFFSRASFSTPHISWLSARRFSFAIRRLSLVCVSLHKVGYFSRNQQLALSSLPRTFSIISNMISTQP